MLPQIDSDEAALYYITRQTAPIALPSSCFVYSNRQSHNAFCTGGTMIRATIAGGSLYMNQNRMLHITWSFESLDTLLGSIALSYHITPNFIQSITQHIILSNLSHNETLDPTSCLASHLIHHITSVLLVSRSLLGDNDMHCTLHMTIPTGITYWTKLDVKK